MLSLNNVRKLVCEQPSSVVGVLGRRCATEHDVRSDGVRLCVHRLSRICRTSVIVEPD